MLRELCQIAPCFLFLGEPAVEAIVTRESRTSVSAVRSSEGDGRYSRFLRAGLWGSCVNVDVGILAVSFKASARQSQPLGLSPRRGYRSFGQDD